MFLVFAGWRGDGEFLPYPVERRQVAASPKCNVACSSDTRIVTPQVRSAFERNILDGTRACLTAIGSVCGLSHLLNCQRDKRMLNTPIDTALIRAQLLWRNGLTKRGFLPQPKR